MAELPQSDDEGSSGRLLRLCAAYYLFYVVTGVSAKWFRDGPPRMHDLQFLVYSTTGGTGICLLVVLLTRWYRLKSNGHLRLGALSFPREYLYIVPSGLCTAVVIPTTTLMYMLPISVMVAMVIMRGSVIVISRAVDAVQIRQGLLKRRVFWQEDVAVLFALSAVGVNLVFADKKGPPLWTSWAAVVTLGSYIVAYAFRIYIMNYYKNTRGVGVPLHNQGFFAVEQIAAATVMLIAGVVVYAWPGTTPGLEIFRGAFHAPRPEVGWALLAGAAYGMVAFFSVFIFMFKGRTATFAGLVNRLTSLIAGTTATLLQFALFQGHLPRFSEWISLGLIFVAVGFLAAAERRRAR